MLQLLSRGWRRHTHRPGTSYESGCFRQGKGRSAVSGTRCQTHPLRVGALCRHARNLFWLHLHHRLRSEKPRHTHRVRRDHDRHSPWLVCHRVGFRADGHLCAPCQYGIRRDHSRDRRGRKAMIDLRVVSVLGGAAIIAATISPVEAAGALEGGGRQALSIPAIAMFFVFVAATLGITYWAARRTRSAADFYAAGGGITGFQNGLAIAGDYMSAASFLGISGLVFASGFDGLIYSVGWLVGWPIILFLIAERLRNLGKYTFADVVSFRLEQTPVRILSAIGTLSVVAFYLIAQMVGAGKLIELLFGLPYLWAVILVGALMIIYVAFGGMVATTWVQIIKACLLLGGATFMALAVLAQFGFSPEAMFRKAVEVHPKQLSIMAPGNLVTDPVSAVSLGLALMFGTAGLPHILMRFFTVADAKAARKSVFYATGFIGYFYILTFIIGFGAITFLMNDPAYFKVAANGAYNKINDLLGGTNMAAVH